MATKKKESAPEKTRGELLKEQLCCRTQHQLLVFLRCSVDRFLVHHRSFLCSFPTHTVARIVPWTITCYITCIITYISGICQLSLQKMRRRISSVPTRLPGSEFKNQTVRSIDPNAALVLHTKSYTGTRGNISRGSAICTTTAS